MIEKMRQKKGGEFIHNFVLFITDARAIYIYTVCIIYTVYIMCICLFVCLFAGLFVIF